MVEFMPHLVITLACGCLFVKGHNINNGLWVSLLLLFTDPILVQCSLPFFRQTLEAISLLYRPTITEDKNMKSKNNA